VWKSTVRGQVLSFRLVGLNNQNFIMADDQTGTWWQQVTGEALQGPLKGERLERMPFEQITYEVWQRENPASTVLESRPEFAEAYWPETERDENRAADGFAFSMEEDPDDELDRGVLILAVQLPEREKAYPMDTLREQGPVSDRVYGTELLLVVGDDGRSVRSFDRKLGEQTLEMYRRLDVDELILVDSNTGSEWDFTGTAISGPLEGSVLERFPVYTDYWFDWRAYHPSDPVYTAGEI